MKTVVCRQEMPDDRLEGKEWMEDIEESDLIEARIREIISMEKDLASYLRDLGVPDVRVVIGDLAEAPMIDVAGLELTADEASELITRLDPKWNGYACERSWDGLPTDDTLELHMKREEEARKKREEEERKKREQEEIRRKAAEAIAVKREERRRRRSDAETPESESKPAPPQPVVRELEPEKPEPTPVAREPRPVAPKKKPRPAAPPEDPKTARRQSVADAIAAMRARRRRRG